MRPRRVNVVLGIWLFVSAFLWPHTVVQRTNTWVLGLLYVGIALIAMRVPSVRYLNTVLALWLFISAFALPASLGTTFNNALVADAILIFSIGEVARSKSVGRQSPMRPA